MDTNVENIDVSIASKKKSKSKKSKSKLAEVRDEPSEIIPNAEIKTPEESKQTEEISNIDESQFEVVKAHKKKSKAKKAKIADDDIEKALKEIEQSESSRKKAKEKPSKSKDRRGPSSSEDKAAPVVKEKSKSLEKSPEKENVDQSTTDTEVKTITAQDNLITLDWNTLIEEEENVSVPILAPISQPESDLFKTAEQVATEVTILQETEDLLVKKTENIISESEIKEIETVSKDTTSTKTVVKQQSESQEVTTSSVSSEQNNNDKFFLTDSIKEGSINIVEEITRYEPITKDPETRTIYLITHEEKKLPPIRTVKVFNSKSNSLEESTNPEENAPIIDQVNKITDEKSSSILEEAQLQSSEPKQIEDVYIEKSSDVPENIVESNIKETVKTAIDGNVILKESVENITTQIQEISDIIQPVTDEESNEILVTNIEESSEIIDSEKVEENVTVSDNITETETTITEDELSDILEQAIFGSVQERNKTGKKDKHIPQDIPYQELKEEVKTYSLNLDIDQLGYDYHQFMVHEREHSSLLHDDAPVKSVVKSIVEKGTKESSPVPEEDVPRQSYREISDAEKLLATEKSKITTKSETEKERQQSFPKEEDSKCSASLSTTLIEDKSVGIDIPIEKEKASPPREEAPRLSYQEIQDAEIQLASTIIEKTKEIERTSIVNEETPRFSYHEIQDAENLLPYTIKTITDEASIKEETPKDIRYESSAEDNLLKPAASKIAEEVTKTIIEHTVDLISNESATIIPIDEISTSVTTTREEISAPKSTVCVQKEFIQESSEIMREEVPRQSYHEISDAEVLLASKPTNEQNTEEIKEIPKQPDVEKYIPQGEKQESKEVYEGNIQSYQEIKDAEYLLGTIKSREQSKEPTPVRETESLQYITADVPQASQCQTLPERCISTVSDETLVTNGHVEKPAIPVQAESRQTIYEVPRYSYHELSDAETLFASNVSRQECEQSQTLLGHDNQNETLIEEQIITPRASNKDEPSEQVWQQPTAIEQSPIEEAPQQSYHDIQDAERVLASVITRESVEKDLNTQQERLENKLPEQSVQPVMAPTSPEDDLIKEAIKIATPDIKNIMEHTTDLISSEKTIIKTNTVAEIKVEELIKEPVFNVPEIIEDKIEESEPTTPKVEYAFEIDDLTNAPVPVVYGDDQESIPQNVDDIVTVKETVVDKPASDEIGVNQTKSNLSFEIDDLDDSLVPVVFGDLKKVEKTIQKSDIETQKETSPEIVDKSPEEVVIPSLDDLNEPTKDILATELIVSEPAVIDKEDQILQSTTKLITKSDATHTISTEFIQSEVTHSISNVPENIKDFSNEPEIIDTPERVKDISSTDLSVVTSEISKDLVDSSVIEQIIVSQTDIDNLRPEKSPIHSLHDLLPDEIDSIPEFKPSLTNTVLFSNLSADAPEFTPSYMYQTVESTVSETKPTDIAVGDTTAPAKPHVQQSLKQSEDIIEWNKPAAPENEPTATQISYSSILQTKKAKKEPQPIDDKDVVSEPNIRPDTNTVPEAPVEEEHIETKTKRNKKKKKKEDRKEVLVHESTPPVIEQQVTLPEPINVWARLDDDGKTYAEVVAEGLEHEEKHSVVQYVQKPQVIPKSREPSQIREEKETKVEELSHEVESIHSSWAKIVSTNRPSPDRIIKVDVQVAETVETCHKAPVILVEESDSEHHKPEVEVDAEGFITVERHRRSRSRSRDNHSRSTSKVTDRPDSRDKSQNRFDPLSSTLKPEETEVSPSSPSEDEKQATKKGRKSRSSKSKEKEIKPKIVELIPSTTSDEDKQPPKKDKKKRSSKSKEKSVKLEKEDKVVPEKEPSKKSEIEKSEPKTEIQKTEVVHVIKEETEETALLPEVHEAKKKNKKKKKDKKVEPQLKETIGTPTPADLTSSEQETTSKHQANKSSQHLVETPVSTPDSIHTPVKERAFSEAQFWKVDPSELDNINNLSEELTVEIEKSNTENLPSEIVQITQATVSKKRFFI
uniref:Uncharacterized protein n=2 Tax=Pectinophora gossypiella TaxID=13191 RepID=A0A1E1VYR4_PECGO